MKLRQSTSGKIHLLDEKGRYYCNAAIGRHSPHVDVSYTFVDAIIDGKRFCKICRKVLKSKKSEAIDDGK